MPTLRDLLKSSTVRQNKQNPVANQNHRLLTELWEVIPDGTLGRRRELSIQAKIKQLDPGDISNTKATQVASAFEQEMAAEAQACAHY
jgi:hypothetical protein